MLKGLVAVEWMAVVVRMKRLWSVVKDVAEVGEEWDAEMHEWTWD